MEKSIRGKLLLFPFQLFQTIILLGSNRFCLGQSSLLNSSEDILLNFASIYLTLQI